MATNCNKKAREGVLDTRYFERRLDELDARIDDLCGMIAELLERIDGNGR